MRVATDTAIVRGPEAGDTIRVMGDQTHHAATPARTAHSLAGWVLRVNGGLLLATGLAALAADLVGYFRAVGPFASLAGQPIAIGSVEAHTVISRSTAQYSAIPEWYSLLIAPVMALFITCLAMLRPAGKTTA